VATKIVDGVSALSLHENGSFQNLTAAGSAKGKFAACTLMKNLHDYRRPGTLRPTVAPLSKIQ